MKRVRLATSSTLLASAVGAFAALVLGLALSACNADNGSGGSATSGGASGTQPGTGGNAGGATAGGSGGRTTAGSGGSPTGDASGGAGTGPSGSGGRAAGTGGAVSSGGATIAGSGGNSAAGGRGGSAGGAGGAPGNFTCNQVLGFTITSEWYNQGFERGVVDSRWQIKFREHGYITEWANPNSLFWGNDAANGAPISSPCAQGSLSPDHVVLNVLSWTITAQQEWVTDITAAVNTLKMKYPDLRRLDLMTVIRGPGNMLCPTPPAAGETIVMAPELDAAMAQVAAAFPGFVFVAPKFEAPNCGVFSGGGPHLTAQGNKTMATMLSAYFATTQ